MITRERVKFEVKFNCVKCVSVEYFYRLTLNTLINLILITLEFYLEVQYF